jgi:glycosyltransferase involved in cell wall biosynthesis
MKVSIALCTFNGEQYISDQLNSILNQSYPADEIIVCDDGSTDGTIRILEVFNSKFPRKIAIYRNSVNKGTIRNFERAISLSTGELIFLSDQDDIWYPDKIKKMVSFFSEKSSTLLLFSNGDLIDQNGVATGSTLWDAWDFTEEIRENWRNNKLAFYDLLKIHNKVTGATIAFKRKLKKQILPIRVPANYWHDQWLALHAAALNGLSFIEEPLIQYRMHPNQQIGLPESSLPLTNLSTFSEAVSVEEFNSLIEKRYAKLFKKETRLSVLRKKYFKPYQILKLFLFKK